MLVAFHKPCGVLSQFTRDAGANRTLAEFGFPADLYPIGRLDADSEGLLLLSDEPQWNAQILGPARHVEKTYWALVENEPDAKALDRLRTGVLLDGKPTLPAQIARLDPQPDVPPREPPVRHRKNIKDVWIEIRIVEGRNRQVRRMTAAVGHPTLRLIRVAIGALHLGAQQSGTWRKLDAADQRALSA